ncbi:TolC family protein [Puia dinghuensis]|uniref:Transporter n=1 Tax=Puia dinghuensis TaxID=1792502 RepID=A0A8J2UID2_9BACT|nr:TolC family protein [Puia dinghuensis]GGB21267.1 transporter [Puia dinghuensis]
MIKTMTTLLALSTALLLGAPGGARAQKADRLTLAACYQLGEAAYPLTRQRDLIAKTRDYNISNIAKGIYPQLSVNGQATYQSAVTQVTLPKIPGYNLSIPTVPKDQYKLYGEISQTLTDFGINKQRRIISSTDADLQEANLSTDLYALKDRINQLYFGALLIDDQLQQNELAAQDIRTGIAKVEAAIRNGTDFVSSLNKLKAELLTTEQHSVELSASRSAYTDMLSLFINRPVDSTTALVRPEEPAVTDSINRPELKAYDLQLQSYTENLRLTRLNLFPQVSAFFQGGVGQPNPMNLLSTSLSSYYLTGLRLTWTIGGSYTYKKDRLISHNNEEMVRAQRNTFLFNTNLTMRQDNADIRKYRALIKSDDEIVRLRESVGKTSAVQLENGVISANDYVLDVNATAQARQDRAVHEMQLLMTQYNYKTTSGN